MNMKKSIAILLVVLIVISITSVCFAGCDREVTVKGKKQACGASISWVTSGQSVEKAGAINMVDFRTLPGNL